MFQDPTHSTKSKIPRYFVPSATVRNRAVPDGSSFGLPDIKGEFPFVLSLKYPMRIGRRDDPSTHREVIAYLAENTVDWWGSKVIVGNNQMLYVWYFLDHQDALLLKLTYEVDNVEL